MNYEDSQEWLSAKAEYQAAMLVAQKAEDEVGQLKAENAWLVKSAALKEKLVGEAQKAERREAVLAQVKEEYPLVPPSVYEHITDPDALLAVAEDMQKTMEGNIQKSLNRWGPSGAPTGSTGSRKSQPAHLNPDLRERVNKGDRQALAAWKRAFWDNQVMPFVERGR